MGLYEHHIGPRFVRCLCAMADVTAERRKIVPLARGTVLEIGIGPGLNLPFYDPALVEKVIGVDPSQGFLALGARARSDAPFPVVIVHGPAEALPLASQSIDTAVVTYTLCSVADPQQCLSELRRVLKPEGRVLFLEHGLSDDIAVARWQNRLNPFWRPLAVGCNLNRPISGLIEAAGFSIDEIERSYLPGAPRPIGFQCRGIATPA